MNLVNLRWPVISAALLLSPLSSRATVIFVNPEGTGDAPTIAAAYAMAVSGDDILLAPGTFHEHDIVMKSLVDLRSKSDEPSDTIVDAQGLGRCLDGGGLTGAPVIRGITFQNGVHDEEGGILLAGRGGTGGGHNAYYIRCIFRGGSAPIGGAVVTRATGGSAPHFSGCAFEDNEATAGSGGAIWSAGVGEVIACTFRRNQASVSGGAIASEKSYDWGIQVNGCIFEENAANESGGAFFSTGPGETYGSTIRDSYFSENTAANGGAARLNEFDRVTESRFLDNAATGDGGALWLDAVAPDKDGLGDYSWNVFARNHAHGEGGAIYVSTSSEFYVRSSTFVANDAPSGGHLWTVGGPATMSSCILAFTGAGGAAAGPGSVSVSCSDVFGNVGGDFVGPLAGSIHLSTNFSLDPFFCGAASDVYTLRAGSPCLPPLPNGCPGPWIGALGQGCVATSVPEPFPASWGSIKALYR